MSERMLERPKLPFGEIPVNHMASMGCGVPSYSTEVIAQIIRGNNQKCCPKYYAELMENVTEETQSRMIVVDDKIVAGVFNNGMLLDCGEIMPDIANVNVIRKEDKPKVVIVTFADGMKEKAVLDENDMYSLEQGISICITKKLLGKRTHYGSTLYNKLIKRAISVMNSNEKAAKEAKEAEKQEKERVSKALEKERKKKEKRAASKREYEIGIQTEAYVRAIKILEKEKMEELEKELDGVLGELAKVCEDICKDIEGKEETETPEENVSYPTEEIGKDNAVPQTVSELNMQESN